MVTERELEIARKVYEIRGQRMWEEGDRYLHDEQILFVGKFHYSGAIVIPHEDALWLPSPMDYMDMLWAIDTDRYVLSDDGVYKVKPVTKEREVWTFKYDNKYESPAEAWWKAVTR